MNRNNISQMKAEAALEFVSTAKRTLNDERKKEYKSYVKKIPMLIKTNGLAASFAFIFAKSGNQSDANAYGQILAQIISWMNHNQHYPITQQEPEAFIREIIALDSRSYRAVTVEILSLFEWLKRFAEGMIQLEK